MRRSIPLSLAGILFLFAVTTTPVATAATEPSLYSSRGQVSVELLGNGLFYSLFGSFRPIPQVALNIGFSYFTLDDVLLPNNKMTVIVVPITVSYLLGGLNHFFELLAGADLVFTSGTISSFSSSTKSNFTHNTFLPIAGLGYRYWPAQGGFHFRLTAYTLIAPGEAIFWPGLSLGYAF